MVTADEARQLRLGKAAVNHATYKGIFEKIDQRIRARASRGAVTLEYRVPGLVPGRPVYDSRHAVRYCAEKLRQRGFVVTTTEGAPAGTLLHVDWRPSTARPAAAAAATATAAAAAANAANAATTGPPPPRAPPRAPAAGGNALPALGASRGTISSRLDDLRRRLNW